MSDFVIALTIDGARLSERLAAIRDAIRVTRRLGSSALALAYVGAGRFDAFAQTHGLSAWDVAAAGLIAERAGADPDRRHRRPVVRPRPRHPDVRHRRRPAGAPRPAPGARPRPLA